MRDPEKPQQIIDAAIRVFARNGYYNSRVSDIAREAGIASGTIYLYFKTKDAILVTLFREKMADWVAFVRAQIASEPDALAKIRRLVALHFDVLEGNPDLAEVVQVELRQGHKFFRGASAPAGSRSSARRPRVRRGPSSARHRPSCRSTAGRATGRTRARAGPGFRDDGVDSPRCRP